MSRRYNLRGQRGENILLSDDSSTPPHTPVIGGSPLDSPLTPASDRPLVVRVTGASPATIKVQESGGLSPVDSPSSTGDGGSDVFYSSPIGRGNSSLPTRNGGSVSSPIGNDGSDVSMGRDDNPNPWIQVMRKFCCSRSLDHNSDSSNKSIFSGSTVTRIRKEMHTGKGHEFGAQDTPICQAESLLTDDQQELLCRWAEKVQIHNALEGEGPSRSNIGNSGKGTSSGKGKGVDPGNWGEAHLEQDEADPEEQCCALAFWNSLKLKDARTLQELYDLQVQFNKPNDEPDLVSIKIEEPEIDLANLPVPTQSPVLSPSRAR
ncbi:hypothetical protein EDD18DRAFT_1113695 [Armillaria luteobubalina]|uniref:Uncharacterized protein n=1 Tax=Armillaria luteobubalina TaxID=153913 RepID=A0AA39UF41_9AGAR|nr:hypothetical protein EDD18DRAFT_1113695 [Armillaria luteobubalina]